MLMSLFDHMQKKLDNEDNNFAKNFQKEQQKRKSEKDKKAAKDDKNQKDKEKATKDKPNESIVPKKDGESNTE